MINKLIEAEAPVIKTDLTTGKNLGLGLVVKEYADKYDIKKGLYLVVNDEFGIDALANGTLANSGINSAQHTSQNIFGSLIILGLALLGFNF